MSGRACVICGAGIEDKPARAVTCGSAPCMTDNKKERSREYSAANAGKKRADGRKWYAANTDKRREQVRIYNRNLRLRIAALELALQQALTGE